MVGLKCRHVSREAKQQAEKLREQLQASEAHAAKLKQENTALRAQLGEVLPDNEPGFSGRPNGKQLWPRLLLWPSHFAAGHLVPVLQKQDNVAGAFWQAAESMNKESHVTGSMGGIHGMASERLIAHAFTHQEAC